MWLRRPIDKAAVLDALDCPRCRSLVKQYGERMLLTAPDRVEVPNGTFADAVTKDHGRVGANPTEVCPDCGREFAWVEYRNTGVSIFKLDRPAG